MTWFWWLLWLLLSGFIIGVFLWTTKALQDQKAQWKAFAQKNKLNFNANKLMQPAEVSGKFDGYQILLTSEERATQDIRGRKYVTMLQFQMKTRMPVAGVVASGDYRDFVLQVPARDRMTPDGWDDTVGVILTDDRFKLDGYFTPDRVKALDMLMKQKNASVMMAFDDRDTYLRIETVDPLLKPGQVEKLVTKLIPVIKTLEA